VSLCWLQELKLVGLSPRRPGFDPRPVSVGFMLDKLALGQVFCLSNFVFLRHCPPAIAPYTFIHLPPTLATDSIHLYNKPFSPPSLSLWPECPSGYLRFSLQGCDLFRSEDTYYLFGGECCLVLRGIKLYHEERHKRFFRNVGISIYKNRGCRIPGAPNCDTALAVWNQFARLQLMTKVRGSGFM